MSASPNFRLTLSVIVALCMLGLARGATAADTAYYDEATVTHVEPVIRRVPARVSKTRCDANLPDGARLESEYGSLADAISSESGRLSSPRCRLMTETVYREEITGYRVAYSYDGADYVRVLSYDPGATLRVRINVRPQTH